jgi:hypothetical protein
LGYFGGRRARKPVLKQTDLQKKKNFKESFFLKNILLIKEFFELRKKNLEILDFLSESFSMSLTTKIIFVRSSIVI